MAKTIRARFSNGVIEPLDKVNLPEGEEITIVISRMVEGKGMLEALRTTAGAWRDLVDCEELERNIYVDRLVQSRPEPRL